MDNYVISDVHGNAERLNAILKYLDMKHIRKDFKLYILGDLFDRGDDSAEVFNIIKKRQANIDVLKGNHESLFLNFMKKPCENYRKWQGNFAYTTIISFLTDNLCRLIKNDILSENVLKSEISTIKNEVNLKLNKIQDTKDKDLIDIYIEELNNTVSERDMRLPNMYFRNMLNQMFSEKSNTEIDLIERCCYYGLMNDFCEIYDYFKNLPVYRVVNDNFLLVHSGFVSNDKENNEYDTCDGLKTYRTCNNIYELEKQDKRPMLWSRRLNLITRKPVAPNKRFDDLIIVYGHTTTDNFNKDHDLKACYTYDMNQRLASVGLDGKNCDIFGGELNCLNLQDLSQIIVKGTNGNILDIDNILTISEIPYSEPYEKEIKNNIENQKQ